MSQLQWLESNDLSFPPSHLALKDPDGLLAVGGDLSPTRLINAYSRGIFPWYSEGQPLLWWTPNPRMVLEPNNIYISRSLRKLLRKHTFRISVDSAFADVVNYCGSVPRADQDGTWITPEMKQAYEQLHALQIAHSVEVWQGERLVGGLYGIALGRVFFGESMFSLVSGASKVGFSMLCQQLAEWQFELVDCQIHSGYLESFGAALIDRQDFEHKLSSLVWQPPEIDAAYQQPLADLLSRDTLPTVYHWQGPWNPSASRHD